jgi:metallo-beta-lactamase class B
VLLSYIRNELKLEVTGFISNDWHWDSMGGLQAVHDAGIPSYASEMTREMARSKGLPVHQNGFRDSLALKLGDKEILCYYPGPAHTLDNIVVWIPSERILFADCMVKEMKAKDLGFTGDGDVAAYAQTLGKVKERFPGAKIVVPGHGAVGGMELVNHTMKMAKAK